MISRSAIFSWHMDLQLKMLNLARPAFRVAGCSCQVHFSASYSPQASYSDETGTMHPVLAAAVTAVEKYGWQDRHVNFERF